MSFSLKGTVSLHGQGQENEAAQSRLDEWLAMIEGLTERQLTALAVVLEATDAGADCLRKLYRLLPVLASPGPALAKAMEGRALQEWVEYAYQVAVVRLVLSGQLADTTVFANFARNVADEAARAELARKPSKDLPN